MERQVTYSEQIDIDKKFDLREFFLNNLWWLDAVAQGRWQSIEINSGKTTARLPYVLYKRFDLK